MPEDSIVAPDSLRKEFLEIVGKAYAHYGYPEYCGWIEGLLILEPKDWTQKDLSERLGELFSTSTSIPSVNRALKVLESYGVVEKEGSRKIGFTYRLRPSSNLILSMFQQLLTVNQDFIRKLQALEQKNQKKDSSLRNAITIESTMAKIWNQSMEQIIASLQHEMGD